MRHIVLGILFLLAAGCDETTRLHKAAQNFAVSAKLCEKPSVAVVQVDNVAIVKCPKTTYVVYCDFAAFRCGPVCSAVYRFEEQNALPHR